MAGLDRLMKKLPGRLPWELSLYFEEQKIDTGLCSEVDVVLALLRMGHLEEASELSGIEITRCPPYVPCWPPKPVARKKIPKLKKINKNPCLPTTGMFQRYRVLRKGLTREQVLSRGVTVRDLRLWQKGGHIEWRT